MFELTKDTTYEGTVVEYRWENPHTHIIVKVDPGAADPSTVGTWDVETFRVSAGFAGAGRARRMKRAITSRLWRIR